MCEVKIEKLDNQGRGICYVNNKITFVENALPEEQVIIRLTKESKKFNEAEVLEYIMTSKDRVESPCPYFKECGGCELLNLSYENTCKYKTCTLLNFLCIKSLELLNSFFNFLAIIASPLIVLPIITNLLKKIKLYLLQFKI